MPRKPHSHGRSEIWSNEVFLSLWPKIQSQTAKRMRCARKRAGLSQEELSERVGLHCKSVQRMERGGTNPTLATLLAYACACGCELTDLLGDPPSRKGRTK